MKKRKSFTRKILILIAIINVIVSLIYKVYLIRRGALGIPFIPLVIAWIFIFRGYRWARGLFYVYAILGGAIGTLGSIFSVLWIYQRYGSPTSWFMLALVGLNYVVSGAALYHGVNRVEK